jgi:hypothetical protein
MIVVPVDLRRLARSRSLRIERQSERSMGIGGLRELRGRSRLPSVFATQHAWRKMASMRDRFSFSVPSVWGRER